MNGGWYQPVEFVRYTGSNDATITVGGRTFTQGREMTMRASPDTAPLNAEAELVFVGYGLDMPSHGFDDYRGLDVRGKIVVVLSGIPSGTPSDVAAHLGSDKRRMAGARGAIGMITVRTRADAQTVAWDRAVRFGGRPAMTWAEPDGTPHNDGAGLRFAAGVSEEAAQTLFTGARRPLDAVLDRSGRRRARSRAASR